MREVISKQRKLHKQFGAKVWKRVHIKAPYKERQGEIKNIPQTIIKKPLHYKNPNESLFYKERMARVKTTVRLRGKEANEDEDRKTMKRGTKEREHKVGRKVNKEGQKSYARGGQGKKGG